MFQELTSNAEKLLAEILKNRDEKGNCNSDYWKQRFECIDNFAEENILRTTFGELSESNMITVDWADNYPYFLLVNNEGISYQQMKKNMGEKKKEYHMTQKQIEKMRQIMSELRKENKDGSDKYDLIACANSLYSGLIPQICELFDESCHSSGTLTRNTSIIADLLEDYLFSIEETDNAKKEPALITTDKRKEPLIFISHKSDDKKYGDALRNYIIGLGVSDNQLIYTSHSLNKIPLNKNIYDYLRDCLCGKVYIIFLLSDQYLESPACLNEMGAAWVMRSDYTNIFVPEFNFGNPKYNDCAIDGKRMGITMNGESHCKTGMIELKDKIQQLFGLTNDEKKNTVLLDNFIKEIK